MAVSHQHHHPVNYPQPDPLHHPWTLVQHAIIAATAAQRLACILLLGGSLGEQTHASYP